MLSSLWLQVTPLPALYCYTFLLSSRMTPSPHYSTSTDQPVVPLTPAPAGLSLSAPEAKAAAVMPKDKIVLYQVGIP